MSPDLPTAAPCQPRLPGFPRLLPTACALALAAAFQSPVHANPSGAAVIAGQASIVQQGKLTTVTNSNGAVIHWQSFSIGRDETTRFVQPSASSSVLNRVIGADPSSLLGQLQSNGRVFLVNPAGILVGAGARIDVGAFVASSLNIRNEDFLANRLNFQSTPGAGLVRNEGAITTPQGGQVVLVAPRVENAGSIVSPRGEVVLAAAKTVEIGDTASPGVRIAVAGGETAANLGSVAAEAGRIGLFGALVKNSGSLNASSAVVEGGRILLKAVGDAVVDGDARIGATGTRGGRIEILGERVAMADRAAVDASGVNGGGTVLVGGDVQGRNAAVQNAQVTWVGPLTSIRADAIDTGDGGKVVVWADDTARAYGAVSVRGGSAAGNGGFIETSGRRFLDVEGIRVDAGAAAGRPGEWLLDPPSFVIVNGAPASDVNVAGMFTPASPASGSTLSSQSLQTAVNGNASVTIDTTSSGGDIVFDAGASGAILLDKTSGGLTTLNLNAANVGFKGGTTTFRATGGSLTLSFNQSGGIFIDADATVNLVGVGANQVAAVMPAPNKTWTNFGRLNLDTNATIQLYGDLALNSSRFLNAAGGTFTTKDITNNWFITTRPDGSTFQAGVFDNFGTMNVGTGGGSIEGVLNNRSGGVLNLTVPVTLSVQNGQIMSGTINMVPGATLWMSENHGVPATFSGTAIGGGGTLLVTNQDVILDRVSAGGTALNLVGRTTTVTGGLSIFKSLSGASLMTINNAVFGLSGDFTVPAGVTHVGNVGYASGGTLTLPSGLGLNAPSIALGGAAGIDIDGATVTATSGALAIGTGGLLLMRNGAIATGRPTWVYANNLVINGGTIASINNPLNIKVGNDLVMNPVSGTAVLVSTGSGVNIDLASPQSRLVLDGSGGGVAHVVANAATGAVRINFETRGEGGIFVDGVRGIGPGPSTSGFYGSGSQPATLGSNLFVRYGGAVSDICQVLPGLCVLRPANLLAAPRLQDPRQIQRDPDEGIGSFGDDTGKRRRPGVCKAA